MNVGITSESQQEKPRITVLTKKGRRIIENTDEVVRHLRSAFPQANVVTLDGKALATMSMRSQVKKIL